jgi:hypothetical protein
MTTVATKANDRLGVVYPDTDHTAENTLQSLMAEFLRPLIERLLREATVGSLAKKKVFRPLRAYGSCRVGSDQFWYYREGQPKKCVSPDVYVLTGVRATAAPASWLLWQLKDPPLFALEIVSQDADKDYEAWKAYEDTGVRELIVYDPDAPKLSEAGRGRVRVRWQAFRRDRSGALVLAETSNADRIHSETLCCWLRVVGEGELRLLRIGIGVGGQELFQSAVEHERAEKEQALELAATVQTEAERERAEKERERAEKERERAEKERALKLVATVQTEAERERAAKERALQQLALESSRSRALEAQLQELLAKPSTSRGSKRRKRK